ncbi:MAG: PIN domain-containing protein [Candidatus Binatia bacterium]
MIVLDSSFLIAYHNTRDVHHAAAEPTMEEIVSGKWGQAMLLEYVFLEVVTVLLSRRGIAVASNVASIILHARELEFVPCSDLFLDAFETFRNQHDTKLSFTDSAIVTAVRRETDGVVATFDREFDRVAGITIVPVAK